MSESVGRANGLISGGAILVLLGAACAGGGGTPAASPELPSPAAGETLAFSAGGSIYTVVPDGSELREVIPGDRESAWNAAPAFSPDGSLLAFTRDFDVWIATSDGQDIRLLADVGEFMTPAGRAASNWSIGAQSVAWSPSGEYITYVLGRIGGSGVQDVWVVRDDGSERLEVYRGSAFWLLPSWLDEQRIAVYESGRIRVFVPRGADEPDIPIPNEDRGSLTATIGRDGAWLIGPFTHEGPILYGPPQDLQQVATGVSPRLSPDGRRFAYFQDDTLRVASVDGEDDREVLDLTPLGGRDRFFAEQPECFPEDLPGCSYRPAVISWWAAVALYRDEELDIQFTYPASWIEGAGDSPVRPCSDCVVFGPAEGEEPYGVRWFFRDLPEGCALTCLIGNGRRQLGASSTFTLAGREVQQVQIMANLPLGFVEQFGEFINYREFWTAIRLEDESAMVFVAFYRDGDTAAEEETLAAYDALLASVRLE